MTTQRLCRSVVVLASVLFAAVALVIWAAPHRAAQVIGLEVVHASGTAVLRADLGGLFAGMAVLCGVAAVTGRRHWIVSAATLVTAIVVGRAIGWVDAGRMGRDIGEMAVEIGLVAALVGSARWTTRVGVARSRTEASPVHRTATDVRSCGGQR